VANKLANFRIPVFYLLLLFEGLLIAALLIGFGSTQSSRILTLLFIAPVGLLIVFALPKISLTAVFLGIYSLDWLSRVLGILPTQVRWVPEGLIYLMLATLLFRQSLEGKLILRKTPIDRYLIGLLVIGLLSMAFNSGSFFTALAGFRSLLRPLLLFYVVVNLGLDEKYLKRLVILLVILELMQIPICFIQFLLYGGGDQVTGTIGYAASQMTVMLASVFISLLYGLAIVTRSWLYAVVGSLLFFPVLLTEGKAGFFVVPVMVLFLFLTNFLLKSNSKIRSSTLKYAALIVVAFVIIFRLSLWLAPIVIPQSDITSFIQQPLAIFKRYEVPLSETNGIPLSRLGDIQFAWNLITREPRYTLLGYGPGAASPGIQGLAIGGNLYLQYALDPTFLFGDVSAKYSLYSFTQVSATLQEFGIIGLVTYILMLLAVFRVSLKFGNLPGIDPFWRGINLGFSGAMFAFLAYTVYYRVWYWEASAYVFWGLAAMICTLASNSIPSAGTVSNARVELPNG
jgi:hypothetical protein